ncbi:hypothetical protein RFI_25622, partial [Reticulomyxa filosa]
KIDYISSPSTKYQVFFLFKNCFGRKYHVCDYTLIEIIVFFLKFIFQHNNQIQQKVLCICIFKAFSEFFLLSQSYYCLKFPVFKWKNLKNISARHSTKKKRANKEVSTRRIMSTIPLESVIREVQKMTSCKIALFVLVQKKSARFEKTKQVVTITLEK